MGPLSEMPRPRIRWHLPAAVFLVVTAICFASLRIAHSAILSDAALSSGMSSGMNYPLSTQALPIDPIEAARQSLIESLAIDNQRFDTLTQQRNSLTSAPSNEATKSPAPPARAKPGPGLPELRSQLSSALVRLIIFEKNPYASGSEILSVRNQITRLQRRIADLEAHKAPHPTVPPSEPSQPPTQAALLDEQIAQAQRQTITDLQALARLQRDHPAAQAVQPPLPPPASATPTDLIAHDTANSRLIQQTAVLLKRLHMSASQRAAVLSISALYAFALSISLGFILSIFTLLISEGLRASA